ncbi:MAG: YraN family protein [Candidatus Omnitrophica bacterium]|nr:YraN family protein [Candidatus Omnitrophota bacterium]
MDNFYEAKAEEFLKMKGYKIVEKNFRTRFGEIDIIGRDKETIALIEVKARGEDFWVSPGEAVDSVKRKRLVLAAKFYSAKYPEENYRFDVVTILEGENWRLYQLIKNAFLLRS